MYPFYLKDLADWMRSLKNGLSNPPSAQPTSTFHDMAEIPSPRSSASDNPGNPSNPTESPDSGIAIYEL